LQIPLKEGIGGEREGDFMDIFIYCKIILLFNYLLLEISVGQPYFYEESHISVVKNKLEMPGFWFHP
jgi:hypothetical protein